MSRKILLFGSFDVLHDGHRSLFRQAKNLADELVVVVARDQTYKRARGYAPIHDEAFRRAMVASEEEVDRAILGDLHQPYRRIREERPDIIGLGYDQELFVEGLRTFLDEHGLKETRIERFSAYKPTIWKSSLLKKKQEE